MRRRTFLMMAAGVALVAGCEPGAEPPAPPSSDEEGPTTIEATDPRPMARGVSRRPVFRWRLPKPLTEPTLVTFLLAEAGTGPEPVTDEARQRRIATATGLATDSPESLDPYDPPSGCILTGTIADTRQLAPERWYRWTVRAVAPGAAQHADFYFRTRATAAVPGT